MNLVFHISEDSSEIRYYTSSGYYNFKLFHIKSFFLSSCNEFEMNQSRLLQLTLYPIVRIQPLDGDCAHVPWNIATGETLCFHKAHQFERAVHRLKIKTTVIESNQSCTHYFCCTCWLFWFFFTYLSDNSTAVLSAEYCRSWLKYTSLQK